MRDGLGTSLCAATIFGAVVFVALAFAASPAMAAADATAMSAHLSDEAFALLDTVSAKHDTPSPLLGPVGVFAADSQKLSAALKSGDRRAAALAMASVKADASEVDKAAASGGLDAAKWTAIKHDMDSLAALVPAAPAAAAAAASAKVGARAPAPGPVESHSGPLVKVESAEMIGADVMRVRGYMSGNSLRSAGIYSGDTRVAKLDVKRVRGEQMIRFDLQIHGSAQGEVLRVYDSAGRSAQASISGAGEGAAPMAETAPPPAIESPPAAEMPPATSLDSEGNVALGGGDALSTESSALSGDSGSPPEARPSEGESNEGGNTEEIPAATPPVSGPKRRIRSHLRARGPNDVHITISSLTMADPGMRSYMIRGQISGTDLERAGIYVDGRLAHEIALNNGTGFQTSDFAQSFNAVGSEATIRVYRARRDYSETSINLATAGTTAPPSTGPVVINSALGGAFGGGLNSDQLAVQITSVQAAAPSLYVVSGIITGRNLASAGIYQNGVLAQPLNVSGAGGGLGGLIAGLIQGTSRQVSFVGRFNPAMGFATVRAYDRNGLMTEQPVTAGGTYGANPYGGLNLYRPNPYTGIPPAGGVVPGFAGPGIGVAPGIGTTTRSGAGVGIGTAPW